MRVREIVAAAVAVVILGSGAASAYAVISPPVPPIVVGGALIGGGAVVTGVVSPGNMPCATWHSGCPRPGTAPLATAPKSPPKAPPITPPVTTPPPKAPPVTTPRTTRPAAPAPGPSANKRDTINKAYAACWRIFNDNTGPMPFDLAKFKRLVADYERAIGAPLSYQEMLDLCLNTASNMFHAGQRTSGTDESYAVGGGRRVM